MRTAFAIPAVLLLTAAIPATVRAGTLVTTDGETIIGTLKRTEDGWSVTLENGQVKTVATRKVKSIELGGDATKPGRDVAGLQSLRRSVEFAVDLPKIVQRYQTFIAQAKDPLIATQARSDLAGWQTRLDQGLVKVGRTWMTPADRDVLNRQLRERAEAVRLLIKAGRTRDAETAIAAALDQDPQNVSALYLRGVVALNRRDLGEAKKTYQSVQQALPQHAPTLLNLAVIQFRQKQWAAASLAMQQALEAAPVTQALLDVAVELVNAIPPEARRGNAAQKLLRIFLEQDSKLQSLMAARHLHRWGSAWIEDDAFAKLKAANDDAQKKIADLQKDFDAAQRKIATIDQQSTANEHAMRELEQHSYTRTGDGTLVRIPLPRAWYDLQTENQQLRNDRTAAESQLETLRTKAQDAKQGVPAPTYTGVLTPVGEDGVPLPVLPNEPAAAAKPAATQPAATAPSTGPSNVIRIGPPDPASPQ